MNKDLYMNILSSIDEGIYFVDVERRITFWNRGAEKITGFKSEDVLGHFCYDNILNHIDDEGNHLCFGGCPLHKTIQDGEARKVNVYLHHKDGHRVPVVVRSAQIVENGQVVGAVELFTDNTSYKMVSKNLEELSTIALHDQLTELPNRRYLESFLSSKFNEYKTLEIQFGAIFIDIDHFKGVNDTYGHKTGDELLKLVAKTLAGGIRSNDMIARNGGEEFVAILQIDSLEKLEKVSEKLRTLIENSSIRDHDKNIKITVSLGCTMANEEDDMETLLDRADRLMYQSKVSGRNRVTSG